MKFRRRLYNYWKHLGGFDTGEPPMPLTMIKLNLGKQVVTTIKAGRVDFLHYETELEARAYAESLRGAGWGVCHDGPGWIVYRD